GWFVRHFARLVVRPFSRPLSLVAAQTRYLSMEWSLYGWILLVVFVEAAITSVPFGNVAPILATEVLLIAGACYVLNMATQGAAGVPAHGVAPLVLVLAASGLIRLYQGSGVV